MFIQRMVRQAHHERSNGLSGFNLDPDKAHEFHDEILPKESAKVAHFCSMKISQDVRDFAAAQGVDEATALQKGMEQKAVEFVERGSRLYSKA